MPRLEVDREVRAPPKVAWDVLTDLDAAVKRIDAITSIERLGGPRFGVGTRWRETRTMFGREATEEMEVTAVEEGRSYTVEAHSSGTDYESEVGVEPDGENGETSRLYTSFTAQPQTAVAKLMSMTVARLLRGSVRKALERDLDDIATAAELSARAHESGHHPQRAR